MKTKKDLLDEIISQLKRDRKENWQFYHEAQVWKKQGECVKEYDELIDSLENLKL